MNLRIGAVRAGFPLQAARGGAQRPRPEAARLRGSGPEARIQRYASALALGALVLTIVVSAACGGSRPEPGSTTAGATTEGDSAATTASATTGGDPTADEIAGLVEAWYARADPDVCGEMTAKLLKYGWGEAGKKGVKACRKSIRASDPVADTKVDAPEVSGDRATVVVAYTLGDASQRDKISLVRTDGAWQLDAVRRIS